MSEDRTHTNDLARVLRVIASKARTDTHAERFKGTDGWGYKPVGRPLDDAALHAHLNGGPHIGAYLISPGQSTTLFAVLDLDDHDGVVPWDDMRAFAARIVRRAKEHGLNAWAVRSGGGRGIHLWFFWSESQSAADVRTLLKKVLAAEGFTDGDAIVTKGQIRIFPEQDGVAEGKHGSLVAFPFGRESVPLDADMNVVERPPNWLTSANVEASAPAPVATTAQPRTHVRRETVIEALSHVPNADLSYDEWIKVGFAIRHALGDDGKEIFAQWSARSAKNDPHKTSFKWNSFADDGGVTVGTLFRMARANGWRRSFALSDVGNGERIAERHGVDMLYCYLWEKWMVWDGARFRHDDSGESVRRAKDTVTSIYDEASRVATGEPDRAKAIAKWASASQQRPRVEAALFMAQSELSAKPDDFDRDNDLLNLTNGTLDLKTLTLRDHRREDRITKLAPVALDPDAKCPLWESFLKRIYADDEELISFVQRAAGYSLTGETVEHVMFLFHGTGRNGKSTLLDTMLTMLGDHARPTEFRTLLARENSEAVRNDLAALVGLRLVTAIEVGQGKKLDEAMVKQITGGDKITARFLHKEFFDFWPRFKLWLAANDKPEIKGVDEAIWSRVLLIPHDVTIPVEERDKELPAKLRAELPGILNWAIDGLRAWREHGLRPPEKVIAATQEYREEMDVLGAFIKERCTVGGKLFENAAFLYNAYDAWCQDNGRDTLSKTMFGRLMKQHGFKDGRATIQGKTQQARFGLRLNPLTSEEMRHDNGQYGM